jgi:hypothetical protein
LGKRFGKETPQAIAGIIPFGENFYRVGERFYKNLRERKARRRMHPRYKGWSASTPKRSDAAARRSPTPSPLDSRHRVR